MEDVADQDQIVELKPGWEMVPNTPEPILVQDEHTAGLLLREPGSIGRTLIVFEGCLIARFGYPNDEALAGHPLYQRGLGHYSCYEILNSSWRNKLENQNKVVFPAGYPFEERHFVITFWDSMFECLANDMQWEPLKGSPIEALRRHIPNY